MSTIKPKDINELIDQLNADFHDVGRDPKRMLQARERANLAGKITNAIKTQLVYALARGEEPDIPFLGKTSGRPLSTGAKFLGT